MLGVLIFFVCVVYACSTATAFAQASPSGPQDDTQLWSDVQFTVPLSRGEDPKGKKFDRVALLLAGTLRLGRNVSHPVDERASVAVEFRANPLFKSVPNLGFRFTPGYLYQGAQPSEGRKSYESRLMIAVTPEYLLGNFLLRDRNQIERRFRNSQPDATRYRNRFQVDYQTTLRGRRFTVYASNEVFYDWSVNDWVRNRFSIGTTLRFSPTKERYTGELYYLRQNDGRSRPGDLHVIGSVLRIRLD
jgi:hypothetical protein